MRTFTLFNTSEHDRFQVRALMTNKAFGDMHPQHDTNEWPMRIQRMQEMLGMDERTPLFAPSVAHTDNIMRIDETITETYMARRFRKPENHVLFTRAACDGIIIRAPHGPFGFFIYPADCPTILLYAVAHSGQEYFAFLHASTQTLLKGIINHARQLLEEVRCLPRDIDAATLPGIKPCCYGTEDAFIQQLKLQDLHTTFCDVITRGKNQEIKHTITGPRQNQPAINLPKALSILVSKAGIPHAGLRYYDECTSCSDNQYFSHVRGDTQRNGLMVHIKRRD